METLANCGGSIFLCPVAILRVKDLIYSNFPFWQLGIFLMSAVESDQGTGGGGKDLEELLSKFSAGMHVMGPEIKPNCVRMEWNHSP